MTVGIILAAGRGKRFGAEVAGKNKVAHDVAGKPLVVFGVELLEKTADKSVVVVGMMAETVKAAVGDRPVVWVNQEALLGTGDAVKAAIRDIEKRGWKPDEAVIGYGDHMMLFTPELVEQMKRARQDTGAAVVMLSTIYTWPDVPAWGRIVRDQGGEVDRIVEQKAASEEEKQIRELNVGFYCVEWNFLVQATEKIRPNSASGEYYLTDIVQIARGMNKQVVAIPEPFEKVGWDITTHEDLQKTEGMLKQ